MLSRPHPTLALRQSLDSAPGLPDTYDGEDTPLSARHFLISGDPQAALGEAETGLLHAVSCRFGLLHIELLVVLARIRLAWPDPPKAIQAAREALDLATHPTASTRGARRTGRRSGARRTSPTTSPRSLAQRAFKQAVTVRKHIRAPWRR